MRKSSGLSIGVYVHENNVSAEAYRDICKPYIFLTVLEWVYAEVWEENFCNINY